MMSKPSYFGGSYGSIQGMNPYTSPYSLYAASGSMAGSSFYDYPASYEAGFDVHGPGFY